VPDITYNVFRGTLNPAKSSFVVWKSCCCTLGCRTSFGNSGKIHDVQRPGRVDQVGSGRVTGQKVFYRSSCNLTHGRVLYTATSVTATHASAIVMKQTDTKLKRTHNKGRFSQSTADRL